MCELYVHNGNNNTGLQSAVIYIHLVFKHISYFHNHSVIIREKIICTIAFKALYFGGVSFPELDGLVVFFQSNVCSQLSICIGISKDVSWRLIASWC